MSEDPNASIDIQSQDHTVDTDHKVPSICKVFVLLTIIVTGQQVTYMTSQFYSANIAGNKWFNGIEFGTA